jgi:predicted RecA/RadA family phage recombinase
MTMYVDNNLLLSGAVSAAGVLSGQVVALTDTSGLSTNAIDAASQGVPTGQVRDMGEGQQLYCRVCCLIGGAAGTSTKFEVIASDAAAGTGNVYSVGSSDVIPLASIVAGARWSFPISPRLASKGQRYLTGRYTCVGAMTTQSFTMDIGTDIQDNKVYPVGFAVL